MKAIVDEGTCIGCGLCEQICPEVFEMENDIAKVKVDLVQEKQHDSCQEAADSCPVDAISIKE